jgi:hypothetical protein
VNVSFTRIDRVNDTFTRNDQLDGEVADWIREAYAVGRREHLSGPPRDVAQMDGVIQHT